MSENTGQPITVEMVVGCPVFFLHSYTACATLCSCEATILVCFSFKKITKNSLLTGWTSAIIYLYQYAIPKVMFFWDCADTNMGAGGDRSG